MTATILAYTQGNPTMTAIDYNAWQPTEDQPTEAETTATLRENAAILAAYFPAHWQRKRANLTDAARNRLTPPSLSPEFADLIRLAARSADILAMHHL